MIAIIALTGCTARDAESAGESSGSAASTSGSRAPVSPDGATVASVTPDNGVNLEACIEENADTVGWLIVPGTEINDVVVQKPDDPTNLYYKRRDFQQNDHFDGCYYADYRAAFGDGSREQLGVNACIYGHSMTDDPEDERYSVKFAQLHDLRDPEKAKKMPYIYFSTPTEDMVFEIFAVFLANCDNTALPYNANPPAGEFVKMIKEEVYPRSYYKYDVDISEKDKFLTLSTCIYLLEDGTEVNWKNTYYRYAVMARLVEPDAPLKTEAAFTVNENRLVDPDGKWK